MLLEFIRYMRGYVLIGIHGRFPERFINITSQKGIRLWRVTRCGEGFTGAMYMADYRRARALAHKAGVRLRLHSKHGLPTRIRRWRDRMGIAVGAFVFLLTVFVMSQFIWSIDVSGLDTISESELRTALREQGVYVGAFRPAIDSHAVSRAVMLGNSRIGWMAVNITGSYASVEIKEEAAPPQIPDFRQPLNIKAGRDGTILRIEAGQGEVVLKEGSGVTAGQLVVSGVMEDKLGGARLVRAQARVIAATVREARFCVPDALTACVPDGEVGERRTLSLFGLRLPLSGFAPLSDRFVSIERSENARLMDTELPLGVTTQRITGLTQQPITLDDDSAKELLDREARLYEIFTLGECTVTGRRASLTHADGVYALSVVYDCVEDIARESVIGTDEGTERVRVPSLPEKR